MNRFLNGLVKSVTNTWECAGPVLDVGAYLVDGQESLCDLRPYFPGKAFVGLDFRRGPGIDIQGNAQCLPLATGSIPTVVSMSCLEHVARFWEAASEFERVLRPDGIALISAPFYFHIHNYPSDYWRFTPEAFELLFGGATTRILGWQGSAKRPLNTWVVLFGKDRQPLTRKELLSFSQALNQNTPEPIGWFREIVYGILAKVLGRRVFSPWLDRDGWGFRAFGVAGESSSVGVSSKSPQLIQCNPPD